MSATELSLVLEGHTGARLALCVERKPVNHQANARLSS